MSENNNEDPIVASSVEDEAVVPSETTDSLVEDVAPIVNDEKLEVAEEAQDENIITTSTTSTGATEVKAMGLVGDGAIGSTTKKVAPKKEQPAKPAKDVETVAVFSSKSVNWVGVGKISRGYNILEKTVAEKWLQRWHCRQATPEEVAKEFGVL